MKNLKELIKLDANNFVYIGDRMIEIFDEVKDF